MVREDLTAPQQVVQACHACLEAGDSFTGWVKESPVFLVLLGAKNEKKLKKAAEELVAAGIELKEFYEPDIGNELTAICSEPIYGTKRERFRKYQLLGK